MNKSSIVAICINLIAFAFCSFVAVHHIVNGFPSLALLNAGLALINICCILLVLSTDFERNFE